MKIYLLTQNVVDGYDTYDSCVVCAENEEEARKIHPAEWVKEEDWKESKCSAASIWVSWKDIDKIKVTELGEANNNIKKGCILASFNAG
jgi:hypothetical protein